ncbi:transmembrane protein 198 isoform X2 [Condylostylus longicornis]|uniref:transmembrane protein 198 isoform X2 n=1 Tax=Condylostylus longicornis TaxID=2530218 RepID=UPI00244DFD06|nr:transmembrane protein 198 isoform X2 [Condylostylus longicornis]
MHYKEDYGTADHPKELDWPFLIKGIMDNPSCPSTPPETVQALLWTTVAVFGIVYALLGYRCLRAIGFLSGLLVGANTIFILQSLKVTNLETPADSALAIVSGFVGAVLGSAHPVASALVSAFAGAILAAIAMVVCVATMPDNEFGTRELYVAIIGGAIIFAVLTLCCVKYVTILASSIVGTAMIMASVDFFMHNLETIGWLTNMKPNPSPPPCWGGVLLCSWPVAAIVSVMVQCFITGWRVDHRKRIQYRRQIPRSNSRPRETREEARQRKYRYLYQVRTARGDIISQISHSYTDE